MRDGLRLSILDCGAMHADKSVVLRSTESPASSDDQRPPGPRVALPSIAVLIEHPEGTLLWDAGIGRDWERDWAGTGLADVVPYEDVDEHRYLDSRLRQRGYETGDIDTLVLSHLHMDHVGCAKLFDNGHTDLIVHEAEWRGASAFDGLFSGGHIKADYAHLPFRTVTGDTELLPGVHVLETPGHTWGTMSLYVDLPEDGPMIFTSDSIYLEESITDRNWGSAVWDSRAWLASVDKILALRDRTRATVVYGHDSRQMSMLRTGDAAYYH